MKSKCYNIVYENCLLLKKGKCFYLSGTQNRAQREKEREPEAGPALPRSPGRCRRQLGRRRGAQRTAGLHGLPAAAGATSQQQRAACPCCGRTGCDGFGVAVEPPQEACRAGARQPQAGCRGSCCGCCRAARGARRLRLSGDSARSVRGNREAPGRHSDEVPGANGEAGQGRRTAERKRRAWDGGPSWPYRRTPAPSKEPKENGSRRVAVSCFRVPGPLHRPISRAFGHLPRRQPEGVVCSGTVGAAPARLGEASPGTGLQHGHSPAANPSP